MTVTPFLKQVASAYYERGSIENTCFIFPNRRSEVFFIKYLSDIIAGISVSGKEARPLTVPQTCTVNDFIYRIYDISPTDRISLLTELHTVYSSLFPGAESLDEFIFWGDIILGDFNDVDKYLADPYRLFANIADLKSIQDSYSYLSDRQRKAIETFVSHFSDRAGRLTVDLKSENPKVKEKFLRIWNILYPLYISFRERLDAKGMAYEGMVYRKVAERFTSEPASEILGEVFPYAEKFVFTGLNALNECEKTIMRKMMNASLAEFCWDYSGAMIRDRYNKSSFFMEENVKEFPQSVVLDREGVSVPDIRVISVPSASGQVKQLPHIFREIAGKYTGGDLSGVGVLSGSPGKEGADCAVVLPDEGLLMTVLDTIPPEIRDVNVTMGYPMSSSSFYMFMFRVADLQMTMRKKGDVWYFYHKPVRALFSDRIFRAAVRNQDIIGRVAAESKLYIPAEDLAAGGICSVIFRPVITDRSEAGQEVSERFAAYLEEVIESAVAAMDREGPDRLEIEFATRFYKTLESLGRINLPVRPQTYVRILKQILSPVSVPFKGEPLQGLQIMGPLETRALDFDNIVIMSANEGVFPRRSVSSSFIPPELRKGFGLPTYEYQDAVWAYYFYRMLSRASNVWLLYDSRTEGLKSGEESRYIKQLVYHFDIPVRRYVVSVALSESAEPASIPKTEDDIRKIRNIEFSATALQKYLECPARFYYDRIRGLGKPDEVSEVLDDGLFGTVYHEMMHYIYDKGAVDVGYLSSWLGRRMDIKERVKDEIMKRMHTLEVSGRNLVAADVIVRYVMKTLSADKELLEASGKRSFRILGLEKAYKTVFGGFRLTGVVDRIDSFSDGVLRIVDYKTGNVKEDEVMITSFNAERIAETVFHSATARERPKIALQLYIYDKFLMQDCSMQGFALENCVYSTRNLFSGLPESFPVPDNFISSMDAGLEKLFSEMTDASVPFTLTDDVSVCEFCDFKTICGR